jgi:type VI secretion system protein VasI
MKGLFIGALLLTPAIVHADNYMHDMAVCAIKGSDKARLNCYDSLANKLGVSPPSPVKPSKIKNKGKWQVNTAKSQIDDSNNVNLWVMADDYVKSGYDEVRPELFVRCSENKTSVFITWDLYLGMDSTSMLTRLDTENAVTNFWSISTDNKAVFTTDNDVTYVKSLFGHDRLLAKITPYGASPVIATFSITGLKDAVTPLRKACKW